MVTYVNDLRLSELATGEGSGTWGTTTNTNLELIGEALGYGTEQSFSSDADATTTIGDGVSDPARAMYFKVTSAGNLTATRTLTIAPNTVSRVMFIENATSGSQSIAISQGSGANVTIATGKTAVVYLDGAGSGAAVVDAMALVDPGVTDTLAEVLTAGNTTTTDQKIQFRDSAIYINSSADGQLDLVADTEIQIAATTVDINGNLDVSGTTVSAGKITADAGIDIDNINIDGTTIALSSGDLTLDVAGNIRLDADDNGEIRYLDGGTQYAAIKKDGNNALFQSIVADGDFIIQGIDGSSFVSALTLDMSTGGTAYFADDVRLTDNHALRLGTDADIVFYHDNSNGYLENGTGDLTLDVAGDIILDADGGDVKFKDGGTEIGLLTNVSSDFALFSRVNNKDISFYGLDDGSTIQALTLDMSEGGSASFNKDILLGDNSAARFGADQDLAIFHDNSAATIRNNTGDLTLDVAGDIILDADGGDVNFKDAGTEYLRITNAVSGPEIFSPSNDGDLFFKGVDGGSTITALTLDMSASGRAIFNNNVVVTDNNSLIAGSGDDLQIFYNGTNGEIDVSSGDLTLDVAGDINLDSGGSDILLKVAGTSFASFRENSGNFRIKSEQSDKDMLFMGNDGGSEITALTLDMSAAGAATFNNSVTSASTGTTFNSSAAGGYLQVAGSSSNYWAIGSTGGTSAPTSASTSYGLHHWNGSAWSNPFTIAATGDLTISSNTTQLAGSFTNTNTSGYGMRITTYSNGAEYGLAVDSYGGGYSRDFTVGVDGNVNVLTGNLVIGTAGKGIDFSATAGSGTSELLADYEEGTFSPTIATSGSNVSYSSQLGSYTKIGRAVHFSFSVNLNVVTSQGSGTFELGGLPFASASTNINNNRYTCQTYGVDFDSSKYQFYAYTPSTGVTTLRVLYTTDNGNWVVATTTTFAIGNSDTIVICGTYFTD